MSYIYGLIDLREPDDIRYVGKTIEEMSERFDNHLWESKNYDTYKDRWIRLVLRDGLQPTIFELEQCEKEILDIQEIHWIDKLKKEGHNLTNSTNGGTGGATNTGKKFSKEWREKMSKAKIGKKFSLEHCKNMSLCRIGVPQNKEGNKNRSLTFHKRNKLINEYKEIILKNNLIAERVPTSLRRIPGTLEFWTEKLQMLKQTLQLNTAA